MLVKNVSPGEVRKAHDRTQLKGLPLKNLVYSNFLWTYGWIEHDHYALQARMDGGMNIYFLKESEPVTQEMQDLLK